MLIGSPFDGTGAAYAYDASGNLLQTYLPIDGGGDFGAAVAAVGSNILIGSPLDNGGAGAAFLYDSSGTWLKTFVQPDGGGNFGASVAGSEQTALIGAPGANLGTAGTGQSTSLTLTQSARASARQSPLCKSPHPARATCLARQSDLITLPWS